MELRMENLDSYESTIKTTVRGLRISNDNVDVLANTKDDYTAELTLHSWRLQEAFRKAHGFNVQAERRYVCKGLWNETRMFARRCRTRKRQLSYADPEYPAHTQLAEVEAEHESREALRVLERELAPHEYAILRSVGAAGGSLVDAYDPNSGASYTYFARQVRKLRARARKILEK